MTKTQRSVTIWCGATLLVAVATHLLAVVAYPGFVMNKAISAMAQRLDDLGVVHAPKPTDRSRQVVRPSPDLIYSVCVFDVSEKPFAISAPVPDSYMSVSLYAMNTDNFFVANDTEIEADGLRLVLTREPAGDYPETGPVVVHAPSDQGLVLFRYFAGNAAQTDLINKLRRQIECKTIPTVSEMQAMPG